MIMGQFGPLLDVIFSTQMMVAGHLTIIAQGEL